MSHEKCLIVTGGKVDTGFAREFMKNRAWDFIIAVDRGLRVMEELSVTPNLVVGDFDTAEPGLVRRFRENPEIQFEQFRPEKDETDTELALIAAEKRGYREVDVLGALGGRLDHEFANVQLLFLYAKRGVRVILYDPQNKIYIAKSGDRFPAKELYGKYVSFIPVSDVIRGLTLRGFKYPLENRDIVTGRSLLISNEVPEEGLLTFESGSMICVESHD